MNAQELGSCEISICKINTCETKPQTKTTVSFKNLPSLSNTVEDFSQTSLSNSKLLKEATEDSQNRPQLTKKKVLPTQQSIESAESLSTETTNKKEKVSSQMPIAAALFVATCVGSPAIAVTGLKLGMAAALGGGILGYATGKMMAEHE